MARFCDPSSARCARVVAAVVALTLLVGCDSGPRPLGGGGPDVRAADVVGRPWPDRVTPAGQWSASLEGTGPRMTLTTGGTVAGGLAHATVNVGLPGPDAGETEGPALFFPDGSWWYPQEPFRVDGEGDVPFAEASPGSTLWDSGRHFSLDAAGHNLVLGGTRFDDLIAEAGGQLAVRGKFVNRAGNRVDGLTVPSGTSIRPACADPTPPVPTSLPAECESSATGRRVVDVRVEAVNGTTVRSSGDGETAVAGMAGAKAEGRSWDGVVVALQGSGLDTSATFDGRQWSVSGSTDDASQVWVDVWPVADTVLEARSYSTGPGFFDTHNLLWVEWVNVGYASSQVFEAEGTGPGSPSVGFDLNKSLGHDAGLGVRRGDRVKRFKGGGDVDSNLAPGGAIRRELSYGQGQPAGMVLRGNFPEVQVELEVPSA